MKSKHDYSSIIVWAALGVTVARYVGAFLASDMGEITGAVSEVLTVLMGLSGVGMGFLDVLGLAYVFDGWRRVLPNSGAKWSSRFKVLTFFVVGLFVVGLAILTPFTVSRIRGDSMYGVLSGADWLWSLAVNLAPLLLIGGVTFSQSGFVTIRADTSDTSQDTRISKPPEPKVFRCLVCGETFKNQQAKAIHSRWKHPKTDA